MRIACPACNAAYQVPDEQLRAGRVVRCARCGTDWAPIEAVPEPEPEPIPEPEPVIAAPIVEPAAEPSAAPRMMLEDDVPVVVLVPPPPPPPAPKPQRRLPLLAIAWVVSLAVVIGALAYLVLERDRVMAAWPPSIRAYAALKLTARPPVATAEKAQPHH